MTPYLNIEFPPAPEDRPYVYVNMVATIDGKTVSGTRDEDVTDLGSDVDHAAMKALEIPADAVLVGAQTLRATTRRWRPKARISLVATRSGDLPRDARYFEGESYVIAPENGEYPAPWLEGGGRRAEGGNGVDWHEVMRRLRSLGVERLYALGGSELNAELLGRDLVDELFLTVAPKVKLGRELPTYAGGEPLPRGGLMDFRLIESHIVGDEAFLRYRRKRDGAA